MKKIIVTGASGFIGKGLVQTLASEGFEVIAFRHGKEWSIPEKRVDLAALEGAYALIYLAGTNIGQRLWTKSFKEAIASSRIDGTSLLVEAIKALKSKPQIFMSASSIGYYGDRMCELLTEDSSPGNGFLADVTKKWEKASLPLEELGISRFFLRTSMVLSFKGGLLAKMAPFYRLGLGAILGEGKQWMSWIAYEDYLRAVVHILKNNLAGPVIMASEEPVRQKDFAKALAKHFHKKLFLKLPRGLLKLLPGGMGQELFLTSCRVQPQKLLQSGFVFSKSLDQILYR